MATFQDVKDPTLRQSLERATQGLVGAIPFTKFTYVNVTFDTNNLDVSIPHDLRPDNAESVRYEVVRQSAPAVIYQDLSADRKPWQTGTIFLRASAPTTARLRLSIDAAQDLAAPLTGEAPAGAAGTGASFGTVAVAGQGDVVADIAADTLTLAAGTAIALTTTPASDTVTMGVTITTTDRLLGRDSAGAGVAEEIGVTSPLTFSGANTIGIADGTIGLAKLVNLSASKVLGRGDSGAGAPEELTLSTNTYLIGTNIFAVGNTTVSSGDTSLVDNSLVRCNGAITTAPGGSPMEVLQGSPVIVADDGSLSGVEDVLSATTALHTMGGVAFGGSQNATLTGTTTITGADDVFRIKVTSATSTPKFAGLTVPTATGVLHLITNFTGTTFVIPHEDGSVTPSSRRFVCPRGADLTVPDNGAALVWYDASQNRWQVVALLGTLIANADVSSSAAIAYSKLNLATSIVNADINGSAAIAWSKLSKSGAVLTDIPDCTETTYTPAVAFGGASVGVTYTTQVGKYVKRGNKVSGTGYIKLSSKGSSTGQMTVSLPVAVGSTPYYGTFTVSYYEAFAGGVTGPPHGFCNVSSSTALLYYGTAGGSTLLDDTLVTNTSGFVFSFEYFT